MFEISEVYLNVFSLAQTQSFDHETETTIQIQLASTEIGDPVMQTFTINLTVTDVNDNPPVLSTTQFSFTEGEWSENQQILDLSQHVFDVDSSNNGIVGQYKLVYVTNDTIDLTADFVSALDESTGVLSTQKARTPIDLEMLGNTLNFMVNITDKGEPPISRVVYFTVNIQDTNDNSPLFENTSYTFYLQENQPSGSFVGMVIANDPDYKENGTVVYYIVTQVSIHCQ